VKLQSVQCRSKQTTTTAPTASSGKLENVLKRRKLNLRMDQMLEDPEKCLQTIFHEQ
jgi:hypothetical protein